MGCGEKRQLVILPVTQKLYVRMRIFAALKLTGIVCLLALAIRSCQKELSNESGGKDNQTPSNCDLAKISYYDSAGRPQDQAGLIYTNEKITRVNFRDYY